MSKTYEDKYSIVQVEMNGTGEVRSFGLTVGSGIMPYLMQQAGESGTLTLLCGDKAYGIPMANIAQVTIEEFKSREARDAALGELSA